MATEIEQTQHLEEIDLDRILENMFLIMLFIHKKLLKPDINGISANLTRLHFAVMGELNRSSMTMSELANALMMTKPQLTHLVEPLVEMGLVERRPDEDDRRVINLAATAKGRKLRDEMRQKVKETTKIKLSGLTSEELAEMSRSLETLRSIISKL